MNQAKFKMTFATVQEITNEVTGVQMRVERNNETRTGNLGVPFAAKNIYSL